MKQNFAINLTTCSKKDRKEAIRLAKENGWKGKYVRRIGGDLYSCWHNKYKGHVFKVLNIDSELDCYVELDDCEGGEFIADGYYEPATKEEYEAQNNIDYKAKYYELKKELERLSKL